MAEPRAEGKGGGGGCERSHFGVMQWQEGMGGDLSLEQGVSILIAAVLLKLLAVHTHRLAHPPPPLDL